MLAWVSSACRVSPGAEARIAPPFLRHTTLGWAHQSLESHKTAHLPRRARPQNCCPSRLARTPPPPVLGGSAWRAHRDREARPATAGIQAQFKCALCMVCMEVPLSSHLLRRRITSNHELICAPIQNHELFQGSQPASVPHHAIDATMSDFVGVQEMDRPASRSRFFQNCNFFLEFFLSLAALHAPCAISTQGEGYSCTGNCASRCR